MRLIRAILLAGFTTYMSAMATPMAFESGPSRVALVELYTSEGCSSCPPAEAWLAKLRGSPALWKEVVPVAFHVDYWDHLGWSDRFALPAFTQRQRDYAAAWNAESVYTPEFVLNGAEWHRGELPAAASDAGVLRVTLDDLTHTTVTFKPSRAISGPLVAELVPLAGGIESDVRGGENSGRKLAHEFVALALISGQMESRNGEWIAQFSLPGRTEAKVSAAAAWVHTTGNAVPLQATGGWLKE